MSGWWRWNAQGLKVTFHNRASCLRPVRDAVHGGQRLQQLPPREEGADHSGLLSKAEQNSTELVRLDPYSQTASVTPPWWLMSLSLLMPVQLPKEDTFLGSFG